MVARFWAGVNRRTTQGCVGAVPFSGYSQLGAGKVGVSQRDKYHGLFTLNLQQAAARGAD